MHQWYCCLLRVSDNNVSNNTTTIVELLAASIFLAIGWWGMTRPNIPQYLCKYELATYTLHIQ